MENQNRGRTNFVLIVAIGVLAFFLFRPASKRSAVVAAGLNPVPPLAVTASPAIQPNEGATERRELAQAILDSLYAALRSYHAQVGIYSTDLRSLGWHPPEAMMNYKLGFLMAFKSNGAHEDLRSIDSDSFNGTPTADPTILYSYTKEAAALRLSDYRDDCEDDCTASEDRFELMIAIPTANGKADVWTINENAKMTLVHDGSR